MSTLHDTPTHYQHTHSSETAAGFSPPPSTLTTGTLSHTQTFTSSTEVVTAYGGYAVTSIRTMRSPIDRPTAKESSFERALTGINPTFDLQRKNQTVRASIRVCALKRRHVSWAMRARQRARRSSFSLLVSKGRPSTVKVREEDRFGDLLVHRSGQHALATGSGRKSGELR